MNTMKKKAFLITLGLAAVLSAAAAHASDDQIDEDLMQKVLEANKRENFLKDGGSYETLSTYYDGSSEKVYVDEELGYCAWYDGDVTVYSQITMGNIGCGNSEGEYEFYLLADDSFNQVFISCLDYEATQNEIVQECTREGDLLKIVTTANPDDLKESMEYWGVEYLEGDTAQITYTVDADTYALQELSNVVNRADGTTLNFGTVEVTFDPERPQDADEMYHYITDSPDQRTITLILDPDTENEQTYSASFPKGIFVAMLYPENYSDLYLDRECTQESDNGEADPNQDATVYAVSVDTQ